MFAYSFGFDAQMTDAAYPAYIRETLPASTLGYGTNNRYPHFPPKMQDGRSLISSWTPESIMDKQYWKEHETEFQNGAPLNPNWMYRRYLQKNAYDIMTKNFQETANDTGSMIAQGTVEHQPPTSASSYTASSTTPGSVNVPHMFGALNDPIVPQGYESSDLKTLYLSREQLQARKSAPTVW
jgi:hypothetical protein